MPPFTSTLYINGCKENVYDMSSNINPLGPGLNSTHSYVKLDDCLEYYPDSEQTKIRKCIGSVYNINPDNIVCGCGSEDVLNLICRAYLTVGDEAIHIKYGFLLYNSIISSTGATPVIPPQKGYHADIEAILSCVNERTKMIIIDNPNNPTGTYIKYSDIKRLHSSLRNNIMLVLDAAYSEYVTSKDYRSGDSLVINNNNVVVTHSFSKIYGIAGLRVGWLHGSKKVIETINKIRGHFNVNQAGTITAITSLCDRKHIEKSIKFNTKWRNWLSKKFTDLGLRVIPSVTNFILIVFPDNFPRTADQTFSYLKDKNIFVYKTDGYGLINCLRVSVGTSKSNRYLVKSLTSFFI